jgi:hypothetical protein
VPPVDRFGEVIWSGFVNDDETVRKSAKRVARVLGYRLSPRRPARRESRQTRRVRTARTRASARSPGSESDPPPRPRRPGEWTEQRSRTDSPLNVAWQAALVLDVEQLRELVVLAETRAAWLGRWSEAA